jgi:hypothetical protein
MKSSYLDNITTSWSPEKYRAIEQSGEWDPIYIDPDRILQNTMTVKTTQIRHRLATMGDLKQDSGSNLMTKN